jgi:hypothetical protein
MTHSPWLPLLFQYGIGSVVFTAALFAAIKKGVIKTRYRKDRIMLIQVIVGFFIYLAIHTALILISGATGV